MDAGEDPDKAIENAEKQYAKEILGSYTEPNFDHGPMARLRQRIVGFTENVQQTLASRMARLSVAPAR